MPMHDDEVATSVRLVRALVAHQFPAWRDLDVRAVPGPGTVNAIYRLGESLAVRLPLRIEPPEQVRAWLVAEAAASRELAGAVDVACPQPMAIGEPGCGYRLPWAVQTWVAGHTAEHEDPSGSEGFAADLAGVITQMRTVDACGRSFTGPGRGGDLRDHDAWMQECFSRSAHLVDVAACARLWAQLAQLPPGDADVMSHTDLIPGNVVVSGGRLVGLLDTGGFGPADPALDLVSAWHLLDAERRAELRTLLGCSDLEWQRGMAWAFQQAMGLGWYYENSNPAMSALGLRTLGRILTAATETHPGGATPERT